MTRRLLSLLVCSSALHVGTAFGQDVEGLAGQDPATSGTTDVAQEGFQQAVIPEEETKDTTNLAIAAGGLLASGNSRALSLTGAGNFKLRRDIHQFTTAVAANFGRSAAARDDPMETTVENYQGRVRYDLFFAQQLAAFLQMSARHDRFQGLDLRLNVDPGLAYYFIDAKAHQFWGELGYDLQYDVRRDEARVDPDTGDIADKTQLRHNARTFLGYDNQLNKAVTFVSGIEYLQGLSPFEDDKSGNLNWRLNFDTGITSKIGEGFSVATTVSIKYDNNPLPGLSRTDAVTALNLVYTLY
jgi:putative salt-induced outer membrane protein